MQIIYKVLIARLLGWLAGWLGLRLVGMDAVLLPKDWLMFDPALAAEIGINKAVIYQKVDGWIQSNVKRHHNIIAGRAWSYNTIPEWHKTFCWLSKNYVGDLLRQLEHEGRLVSDQLHPKPQVRTKYYSTPAGDLAPRQIGLWESEIPTLRDEKVGDDSSTGNQAIAKPSKAKNTSSRARKPVNSGGVADFPGHIPTGDDPSERKAEIPEARDGLEGRAARERKENPPPVSAPSPSPTVPTWATLLNGMDAEIATWLKADRARLQAWCAFAPTKNLGGGFVRVQMRIPGSWPPAGQGEGQSYISGELAAFIEH